MATNAVDLDGSTQYGTVDYYSALGGLDGTATVEGWFEMDTSVGSSPQAFMLTDGGNWVAYTQGEATNTGINFGWQYSGTNADGYNSSGIFVNGTWVHIAAVYTKDAKTKIYKNGTEISYTLQNTPTGTVVDSASPDKVWHGAWDSSFGGNKWKGGVGCFRIWNTARSQTEISDNKDYYLDPSQETGLILNCNYDEGSGTTVSNDAPSSNDMSLTGSPSWITGPTLSTKSYGAALPASRRMIVMG